MSEQATPETPQAAPPVVIDAAANIAADAPAQSSFDVNSVADQLLAEANAKLGAPPPPEAPKSEPEVVEAKEEDTADEPLAAASEEAATPEDIFAEFEPKRILTDEEIDAKFNRVPKEARAELKEYAQQIRTLEEQVNATPEVPESMAPLAEALNFVVPLHAETPAQIEQVQQHADTALTHIFTENPVFGRELAFKAMDFAWEHDPNLLDKGLRDRLNTTQEHVEELLNWEKAGIFDSEMAKDEFQEHLKSVQPAVMAKLDKMEARNQVLEATIAQLQNGSQRNHESAMKQTLEDHDTRLRTEIMETKVKPILKKVGWDTAPGLSEVLTDWADMQFNKSAELKDLHELVRKGKITSRDYERKKTALENVIQARVKTQASKIHSGLSGVKKPVSSTTPPAAKEQVVEAAAPPLAKPKVTMGHNESFDIDAYEKQLRDIANNSVKAKA